MRWLLSFQNFFHAGSVIFEIALFEVAVTLVWPSVDVRMLRIVVVQGVVGLSEPSRPEIDSDCSYADACIRVRSVTLLLRG